MATEGELLSAPIPAPADVAPRAAAFDIRRCWNSGHSVQGPLGIMAARQTRVGEITMKLSIRALMITAALLWGGGLLLVGLLNLASESYGLAFLQMLSSVYPGFHASRTFGDVLVGTVYAAVDGALCGLLFGWLYNALAAGGGATSTR